VAPSDHADTLIIGGGAAGCVVARRLAESATGSVELLEAGPDLRGDVPPDLRDGWRLPKPPDWGFQAEANGDAAPRTLRRGKLLGGTSWLTRFAVRGAAADFDAWAARGNPGWAHDDVLPTFRRLETDAEFGSTAWHGDRGPIPITRYPDRRRSAIHEAALDAFAAIGFPVVDDHNEPGAVGVGPMPMSSRDGVRVTSADAYLPLDAEPPDGEAAQPARPAIRAESEVATVLVRDGRAVGVRLIDGTEIHAGEVILAAGTYGSPSILMRSGIGPAEHLRQLGIDVLVDLPGVGANLADHPGVDLDSGWRGAGVNCPTLHSIATWRSSMAAADGAPDLMFWATDPAADDPGFYLDPILLKPVARGSVRLRSADPTDSPRITLPDPREPRDLERLVEGYRRALDLANRPEIRSRSSGAAPPEPRTLAALRRRVIENAYSIPHVVGTCRMGPLPAGGDVVDADGRVHGVDGISVIDASIIPDAPSGFPHLITIMLAEHLAARRARAS
jgi:choline dehydrogenase